MRYLYSFAIALLLAFTLPGQTSKTGRLDQPSTFYSNSSRLYIGPGGAGTQPSCGTGVYGCWAIGLDDAGTLTPQAGLAFLKGSYANSCILYSTNGDTPSCLPKNFNQMQGTLNLASQVSGSLPAPNGGHYGPTTFSTLPACGSAIEGYQAAITDSTTATWGATITGSGTNHVYGYCDGTHWTVMGK